jgi:hypothetical protein
MRRCWTGRVLACVLSTLSVSSPAQQAWDGPVDGPPGQLHKRIPFISYDFRNGGITGAYRGLFTAAKELAWQLQVVDGRGSLEISRISSGMSQQVASVAEPTGLQGWQLADELNRACAGQMPSGYVSQAILVTAPLLACVNGNNIEYPLPAGMPGDLARPSGPAALAEVYSSIESHRSPGCRLRCSRAMRCRTPLDATVVAVIIILCRENWRESLSIDKSRMQFVVR